jgi:hypothetical protein
MARLSNAPRRLRGLLILSVAAAIVSIAVTFLMYSITRNTAQVVGIETVPQIIAAKDIKATLASAHSNAMNAMVTNENLGGKFWSIYRKDLNALHSDLIDASKNISYGEEERVPLYTILSNVSAYDYTVGGAVAGGAEVSVDQFMEANRLMQQKILPSGSALSKANYEQLDSTYNTYMGTINFILAIIFLVGFVFLVILIAAQHYLFRKTHRIFNVGLLIATILFSANLIYTVLSINSVKENLYVAKEDAFDSLNALWSARAEAYNVNALESLYLLHNKTGIVQTADTINFELADSRMVSDAEDSKGYLIEALNNAVFHGEATIVKNAIQQWSKYVEVDKAMRNLEYDSRHQDAVALNVGDSQGQSDYEFEKFDAALEEAIKINSTEFEASITSAYKSLNAFPYIITAFFLLIIAACILGMKSRISEYKF